MHLNFAAQGIHVSLQAKREPDYTYLGKNITMFFLNFTAQGTFNYGTITMRELVHTYLGYNITVVINFAAQGTLNYGAITMRELVYSYLG